jgi:hypothetical protein
LRLRPRRLSTGRRRSRFSSLDLPRPPRHGQGADPARRNVSKISSPDMLRGRIGHVKPAASRCHELTFAPNLCALSPPWPCRVRVCGRVRVRVRVAVVVSRRVGAGGSRDATRRPAARSANNNHPRPRATQNKLPAWSFVTKKHDICMSWCSLAAAIPIPAGVLRRRRQVGAPPEGTVRPSGRRQAGRESGRAACRRADGI